MKLFSLLITSVVSYFQIIFEAVTKPSNDPARPFRGHIALDDMVFQRMGSPDLDNCFGA